MFRSNAYTRVTGSLPARLSPRQGAEEGKEGKAREGRGCALPSARSPCRPTARAALGNQKTRPTEGTGFTRGTTLLGTAPARSGAHSARANGRDPVGARPAGFTPTAQGRVRALCSRRAHTLPGSLCADTRYYFPSSPDEIVSNVSDPRHGCQGRCPVPYRDGGRSFAAGSSRARSSRGGPTRAPVPPTERFLYGPDPRGQRA